MCLLRNEMPSLAPQFCLGGGIKEKPGEKTRGLDWRIHLHTLLPDPSWLLAPQDSPSCQLEESLSLFLLHCIIHRVFSSSKISGIEKGLCLIYEERCDFFFYNLVCVHACVYMFMCEHDHMPWGIKGQP